MTINTGDALRQLEKSGNLFLNVFSHGSLSVEIYKPEKIDLQKPHDRDEAYVVISGSGTFYLSGERKPFQTGSFLFVPGGAEHRFENFSDDFSTWVLFYGPKGGEVPH